MGGAVQRFLSSCCTIDFTPVNKWYSLSKCIKWFYLRFPEPLFLSGELLYRQNDVTKAFLLVQAWTKTQYKDIVLTGDRSGRYWWSSGNNVEKILKEALLAPLCGFRRLTLRWLMSYIYGAPILDVSRSHTTTQHSR